MQQNINYSIICGDSFEEDNALWCPSAGQLISKYYNLKFETYAYKGKGNKFIFHSLVRGLNKRNYKLAIINWSSIWRIDYINYFDNWKVSTDLSIESISDTHFSQQDHRLLESLLYIYSAQSLLKFKNIPYIMYWGIHPGHNTDNLSCLELMSLINNNGGFYKINDSVDNKASCFFNYAESINHLHPYDNLHPDQEAHRKWSLIVYDFMKENNIKLI
jgi:hypothetical protein